MAAEQAPPLPLRCAATEAGRFQTFIQQNKAVALPEQALDAVAPSAAEEKQLIGKWVELKLLLHNARQTVDTEAQICIAAGNVGSVGSGKVTQHDFSARRMAAMVASSAPE